MRLLLCVPAFLFVASAALAQEVVGAVQHNQANPSFSASQDGDITTFMEEVATPDSVYEMDACQNRKYKATDDLASAAVAIDTIINLGQKVWNVIEKGKPVLASKYTYANALPQGVRSAVDLESFSPIQARSFRVYGKNGFGVTVYDVTYTLVHRYGGAYSGKGRYLDNVTVLPQNVEVMWGYNLGLDVTGVSTVNIGTKADPIAGITLEMALKISTVMKTQEKRAVFDFHGDSPKVIAVQ